MLAAEPGGRYGERPALIDARADARLAVAVVRSLLLDLLATGDRGGTTEAYKRFLARAPATAAPAQEMEDSGRHNLDRAQLRPRACNTRPSHGLAGTVRSAPQSQGHGQIRWSCAVGRRKTPHRPEAQISVRDLRQSSQATPNAAWQLSTRVSLSVIHPAQGSRACNRRSGRPDW